MTPLRKKMFEVLRAKNLPLETQEEYVAEIAAMAASYKKSPDQLTPEQVRDYLERCARQMIADKLVAFGHFYEGTLGWGLGRRSNDAASTSKQSNSMAT